MSDCCGCECRTEGWSFDLEPLGSNPAFSINASEEYWTNSYNEDAPALRGEVSGWFNYIRPVTCVVHTDWCCHRPTKATIRSSSALAITGGYADPSGRVRVCVEATRDFSKYVYAEVEAEAFLEFPAFGNKHHYADGITRPVAAYTPAFGTNTGDFVYVPRNAQDADAYTQARWPLANYTYALSTHYVGTRTSVRCGYRDAGTDTVVQEFISYESRVMPQGTVAVGCHWHDIIDEQDDGLVRCGLEITNEYILPYPFVFADGDDTGFTFPFTVSRDLFTDSTSPLDPPPADPKRYVVLHAEAETKSIELPDEQEKTSQPLAIFSVEPVVTCAADYAHVLLEKGELTDTSTVPKTVEGGGAPAVTESSPYFVRRPDIISRVPNTVAAADSWHATHLVRRGSALATRNALHHLHLEFVQASAEWAIGPNASPLFPVFTQWSGQADGVEPTSNPTANQGPRFSFLPESDEDALEEVGAGPFRGQPPTTWLWNAISGQHELTPFVGDKRLLANSYHVHYSAALHTFSKAIVTPASSEIETGIPEDAQSGPYLDGTWNTYNAGQYPRFKADYRIAWSVATFPQLWARTVVSSGQLLNGPLDVSLEDSGMTTEAYDAYARRTQDLYGGIQPWTSQPIVASAEILVRARVGLKYTVTRVKGFRRARVKGMVSPNNPLAFFYPSTGAVQVNGDHECNDIACTEVVHDFSIPLESDDLDAISDGEEITKQLVAGTLDGNPIYRTVKVRVSVPD